MNFNSSLFFLFIFVITVFSQRPSDAGTSQSQHQQPKRKLKILVLSPSSCWSHAQYLGKVADTLAEAGHEVVSAFCIFGPFGQKRKF
jgi:hypothetical protein